MSATSTQGCIFCHAQDLVTSSVWPRWTSQFIAKESVGQQTRDGLVELSGMISAALSRARLRPEVAATRRVRAVCRACHNGWMGRIEAKARPTLLALVAGDRFTLDVEAQSNFAAWVAKTIMIAELVGLDGVVTPQSERADLWSTLEAPRTWKIWIAHNSAKSWLARYVRHAATLGRFSASDSIDETAPKDTQSVTLGIGRVLVQVMSGTIPDMKFDLPHSSHAFYPIWPTSDAIAWPPRRSLRDQEADAISSALDSELGSPDEERLRIFG